MKLKPRLALWESLSVASVTIAALVLLDLAVHGTWGLIGTALIVLLMGYVLRWLAYRRRT